MALIIAHQSSRVNMAPDNQSLNGVVSDNELVVHDEESYDNPSLPNEEVLYTEGVGLKSHSVTSDVASEHSSTTNVTSTSSGLGLLSLPPEIRVQIFRDLLLEPHLLPLTNHPTPDIINTCHLIRREASQVMYGENIFSFEIHSYLTHYIVDKSYFHDSIQNIHFEPQLYDPWELAEGTSRSWSQFRLLTLIREFGSPAIVRGTLYIILDMGNGSPDDLFLWFLKALRHLNNFKIVQFEFLVRSRDGEHRLDKSIGDELCEDLKRSLTPFFGPAESINDEQGLRFHPQQYLNSLPPKVDWMVCFDGIRLDWNQDSTNPNEPEASAEN